MTLHIRRNHLKVLQHSQQGGKDGLSKITTAKPIILFLSSRNTPISLRYKLCYCQSGDRISGNNSMRLPNINDNSRLYSLALSK